MNWTFKVRLAWLRLKRNMLNELHAIVDAVIWLVEPTVWAWSPGYRDAYYQHREDAWKRGQTSLNRERFFKQWVFGRL